MGAIQASLGKAVATGQLTGASQSEALARLVYTAYNGSLIAWALHGQGTLGNWIDADIGAVLSPYRKGTGDHE